MDTCHGAVLTQLISLEKGQDSGALAGALRLPAAPPVGADCRFPWGKLRARSSACTCDLWPPYTSETSHLLKVGAGRRAVHKLGSSPPFPSSKPVESRVRKQVIKMSALLLMKGAGEHGQDSLLIILLS